MAESNNSALHWILGAALLLITLFVIVALVGANSQADELNSSAGVANASPTVDSIFFDTGATFQTDANGTNETDEVIELTSGANTTLNISGVVTDTNGDADISSVAMTFWSPEAVNKSCSADPNNCYKVSNCSTQANDADSLTFNCAINLAFWTNSTSTGGFEEGGDWTASVDVTDVQSSVGSSTDTIDVATLLSLTIPGPIDWGTLSQGTSTDGNSNEDQTITQQGNDIVDVQVSGTAMPCSNTGTIPLANIKWELTDLGFGSGTDLTGTPSTAPIVIGYQTSATPVTDTVSWNIQIPSYDVSGTCTGTITMTAVAEES